MTAKSPPPPLDIVAEAEPAQPCQMQGFLEKQVRQHLAVAKTLRRADASTSSAAACILSLPLSPQDPPKDAAMY
jgi:hypothetical protein